MGQDSSSVFGGKHGDPACRTSGRIPSRQNQGFTLIELLIVIVLIAIIAAIALPNLFAARVNANETAAIATLRAISSAQAQFQGSAHADRDWDGVGEYGTFREMSGADVVRAGTAAQKDPIRPAVLSGGFRTTNANGETSRSGYLFKIFLPGDAGTSDCPDESGTYAAVDEDIAETTWCCYAWPVVQSNSGNRSFLMNQGGTITSVENDSYDGPGNGPDPGAGYTAPGPVDSITGLTAIGTTARDGLVWRQVN
jgi:prepilin-type N-terminal cleavage/methylation domain-containing protein